MTGLDSAVLAAPRRRAMLGEMRLLYTVPQMLPALWRARAAVASAAAASPVMVLPGFGAGDLSTWPLRRFLRQQGLAVEGWGLGTKRAGLDRPHQLDDLSPGWGAPQMATYRGEGGVALLADLVVTRVAERVKQLGRPMTLVGWSLGGTIAREVARDLPDAVDQVITLGSPVIGGPKYTAAARLLSARGLDLDWIERQVRQRETRAIQQPVTSIFSRSDAIVSWQATVDHFNPRVRAVEVDVAHLALGFSPLVWSLVLEAIRTPPAAA